jgi:amino-acid N-acetyltransferase
MDSYLSDQFNLLSVALNDSVRVQPVRSSLTVQGAENVIVLDQKGSVLVENYAENATVPVLYPYVYDANTGHNLLCDSSEFMKYMIRELLKLNKNKKEKEVVSVEKIIFIDELGGIPSIERRSNAHVFINLSQEFEEIQSELHIGHLYDLKQRDIHTQNLEDMEMLLEEGITGLITTLDIAIENHKMNPIIYNVLTDRSLVSSSLSTNKISNDDVQDRITKTTIFKKGLTVTVLNSLDEVDLVKLKQLIDDSFKRSLNLDHYVSRVKGNINKIVIVGDYDGCAIVTNEVSQATGLEFPYLDKFAISRAAQGSLGVADMIFNVLMKQVAKRNVLIWRSKKRNPVNGWYFQRSNGSFTLNEKSEFRLFWSGGNGKWDELAFRAFVDIVEGIEPSFET